MMIPKSGKGDRIPNNCYGIGEWYGHLYTSLEPPQRIRLVEQPTGMPCRFMADVPDLAPRGKVNCNKKGGVCSIRSFNVTEPNGLGFGPITATCPNRFLDGGIVFQAISSTLLDCKNALTAKEIPFLIRPTAATNENSVCDAEDVGRIDMVLVHPDTDMLNWCAVELQAVYFSGGAMSKDFDVIRKHVGSAVPMPGAARRPDFRSSGPKRLMPQLQIKVPTLRRWGKKMAVVIDRPFFESLGPMDDVPHVSNADIVWFVVRFDEDVKTGTAKLAIDSVKYTTLERAVEGLTAGIPTSLDDFEAKIRGKL